jgi:hypothetical protein
MDKASAASAFTSLVYDGETDVSKFFQNFYIQCSLVEWDSAKQLEKIPLFLSDKALRAFNDGGAPASIKLAEEKIRKACTKSADFLLFQLYSRKRLPTESIGQYGRVLQKMLTKAAPLMDATFCASLLRAQLCVGASAHERGLIQFSSSLTTASWDSVLEMLEKSAPEQTDSMVSLDPANQHLIKTEPFEASACYSNASLNNRREGNATRMPIQCSYCHYQNHRLDQCRFKQRDVSNGINRESLPTQPERRQFNQRRQGNFSNGGNNSSRSNQSSSFGTNACQAGNQSLYQQAQQLQQLQQNQPNNYQLHPFQQRQQSQSFNNIQQSPNSANTFAIDSQKEDFFSWSFSSNAVEEATVNLSKTNLLKVLVSVSIFGSPPQQLLALVDNGSTHSFINPNVLSNEQISLANNPNSFWSKLSNFNIKGVTGDKSSTCCVTKAKLKIGEFIGEHTFVISPSVRAYDMIIGLDFCKFHNMKIDHSLAGTDLKIGSIPIQLFSLSLEDREKLNSDQILHDQIAELRKELAELKANTTLPSLPSENVTPNS